MKVIIVFFILSVAFVIWYSFPRILVCGNSMFPTYKDGEIISSKRFFDRKTLKVGDVVVVKFKKDFKTSGERVVIKRIAYITDSYSHIYLLGDNPSESCDSREYGLVPISCVVCKINDQRIKSEEV